MESDAKLTRDSYYPNMLKMQETDGRLFRLLTMLNYGFYMVNRDYAELIEEELQGRDTLTYREIGELYQLAVSRLPAGTELYPTERYSATYAILAEQATFYNSAAKRVSFGERALELIRFVEPMVLPDFDITKDIELWQKPETQGKALFIEWARPQPGNLLTMEKNGLNFEGLWLKSDEDGNITTQWGDPYAINSASGNKDIAWEFLKHCTQDVHDTGGGGSWVGLGLIPDFVTARQYIELFFLRPDILRRFWNSVLIMLPVVLGHCLISAPAAYAFEQARWRFKEAAFFLYAVIMLMPMQVVLVPNFIVADWLGLRESYLAIILPGIFAPLGTFLIRQQLRGFPKEYREAAQMDGASHRSYFLWVVLPALRPTIAALAILTFVEYWNLVDQAVVFIRESWREPMSVFLSSLMNQETAMMFVASVFYMLPALFVFLLGQKQMAQGIQLSGLKA